MKTTIISAFAAIMALGPIAYAQTSSLSDMGGGLTSAKGGTVIYVAKEFITMDSKNPTAEAVAVRDGQFIAVGSLADVQAKAGKGARYDRTFVGKSVLPGFVEQHVHPVLAALTMNTHVISIEDWDAIDGFSPAVRDPKGYEKRLTAAINGFKAKNKDKSKPFVSWGYHHYMHGDGMSRKMLNQLAPDFPVVIWHRSCHEFFLNDVALKKVGITKSLVDGLPPSTRAQIDFDRGHFYEQGAMGVLDKISKLIATPEIFKRGLEYTVKYYHKNGITTACEPGGFFSKPMQQMINQVYGGNAVPFNHYFITDGKTFAPMHPNDPKAMIKAAEQVYDWGSGRARYLQKQVKFLTDGAIYSQLMIMKDGYTDGHHGAWVMDPDVFHYAFQSFWDAGFQMHVHNNGDSGMNVLLNNLEEAIKRNPRPDHRTVIVHFGFATEEQVNRAAKLGAIVSSNPYYVTALAGQYKKFGIGPERSKNMVPMGWVTKNNMSFSFHSDMPMAPAKPFDLIWAATNRKTYEGEVEGPEHRVTVEQALRAMTIEAAYSIQLENKIGSIEVGKDANLTILQQSPYTMPVEKLKDVQVWGTMLEGRIQPVLGMKQPKSAATPTKNLTMVSSDKNSEEIGLAISTQLGQLISHNHND